MGFRSDVIKDFVTGSTKMDLNGVRVLKLVKVMKNVIRLINVKPHAPHYKHVNLTFFLLRHPRCVGSITKNFCVLHTQSNTTIFHLVVQYGYNYMFRPYMWTIFRL